MPFRLSTLSIMVFVYKIESGGQNNFEDNGEYNQRKYKNCNIEKKQNI